MRALSLHLPQERGIGRWMLAGAIIIAVHLAIIASLVLWYARKPSYLALQPAIVVTLAPVDASSPDIQDQDIAVGPTMQQAAAAPNQPPKEEEKPVEQIAPPTPPQQADVTLPDKEPRPVDKPRPEAAPPAPETLAAPKDARIGEFTLASSNAYNALVLGHLQRFKRYPPLARGATGKSEVRFVLNRAGEVVDAELTKSSGNRVLDEEALATLRRASPFPAFPAGKPGEQGIYVAPVTFAH